MGHSCHVHTVCRRGTDEARQNLPLNLFIDPATVHAWSLHVLGRLPLFTPVRTHWRHRRALSEAVQMAVVRDFSRQLPPRASRPSSSTRARSARRPEVSRRPHSSNSTPYPPSCRLFTRRTEPLSGASSLDRTAADGARWTTELPGLATDAVDTAGGLAVARHRLRCTVRRWAA